MTHWKKDFPGKYLQVSDLDNPILATIASYTVEDVGRDTVERKPVLRFEDDVKPLVLNVTRAEAVAAVAKTNDTERWSGTRIRIFRGTTRYQGKRVECICVGAPGDGGDDDIGF